MTPQNLNQERQENRTVAGQHPSSLALSQRNAVDWIEQVGWLVAALILVIARRPDTILNPQFWAEDGMYYARAYQSGFHALLMPYAGYFNVPTQLIALAAQLVPLGVAPLFTNLCAMVVQVLPVNLILSSRFAAVPLRLRYFAAILYLALPNCFEIHANLANVQWHLALLACLIVLAKPSESLGWRIFDLSIILLSSLDGLQAAFLIPITSVLWWKRRQQWTKTELAFLIVGVIPQVAVFLSETSHRSASMVQGTALHLSTIVARGVFLASFLGLSTVQSIPPISPIGEIGIIVVGLAVLTYTILQGPLELKLFIIFSITLFWSTLLRPMISERTLHVTFGYANRYDFFPALALCASVVWMAYGGRSRQLIRYCGLALLALLAVGIWQDWQYPRFVDFHFRQSAATFQQVPPGYQVRFDLNPPGWTMELVKRK